jgi:succinate dehydrogenase / fumarate reductase cytochrome b subunit
MAVRRQVGHYPGVKARKRFGYACAALGLVLVVTGLASIWAFVSPKYANAPDNPAPAVSQSVAPSNALSLDLSGLRLEAGS